MLNRLLFTGVFCGFASRLHPRLRYVFNGSRGNALTAALAENTPHRSREHEFIADGLIPLKDESVLDGFGRVKRVGGGSDTRSLARRRVVSG
jgi:hypothetical protein